MHRKTTVSSCDSVRHAGTDTHCIGACSLGPGGQVQSCGMQQAWAWWEGSIQPAGSSAGVRQNPCQELTGPISEGLRPHPCMLISPSEEPGSRAFAGVHCYGYSSSSHTILPEQVNQVEGILALAAQGYVTFGYVMHSQMSQKLQNEKEKVPIWLQTLLDLWKNSKQKSWEETRTLCWKTDTRTHKPPQKTRAQSQKHAGYGKRSLSSF